MDALDRDLPTIRRLALRFLVAYALVQIVFLGAAELAARLLYPHVRPTDLALQLLAQQLATPSLTLVFLTLTTIGSALPNAVLTVAFAYLIAARRSPAAGVALVLTMAGGVALETVTKHVVQRARPDLFRLAEATGYSFPSGHALESACLYGALALALWPVARGWGRIGLLTLAIALPLGIGLSRVYLGVHYPSDVLGGWSAGILWLAATQVALRVTPSVNLLPSRTKVSE